MIGLHVQTPVNDWPRTLTRFPDGTWIKAVDNVQLLDEAKRIHPGLRTVLRHWYDGGQIFGTVSQDVLRQRAREFFRTFIDGTFDQYAHNVDAIEEWNEYNATSHSGQDLDERIAWADAVSWVWTNEYRHLSKYAHIRLVLGNTAIGNDIPWQYAKFAHERDCIIGYHPYVPVRDNEIMDHEWEFYSGRWTVMDHAWKQRGYTVEWLFTEFGPVGYNPPASLNALDGWRHSTVNNANVDEYINVISYWLDRTTVWNQANGNRALGAVLFTTGGGAQWQWFETKQPEIDAITAFMAGYVVNPPPSPPPPPPQVEPRVYSRTVHLLPQNATREQAQSVTQLAFDRKQSVVWSADDAVMNPDPAEATLTARNVIVWGDVPGGDLVAWEQWQAAHYPPALAMEYRQFEDVSNPLLGIQFGQLLSEYHELTSRFNDLRIYKGKPAQHEGIDADVTTGEPDSKARVLCAYPGIVDRIGTSQGAYYNYVVVRHVAGPEARIPGTVFKTWYAHLDLIDVAPGQAVEMGQSVGELGGTGGDWGEHVHFNLQIPGYGLSGYVVNDVVDPLPFLGYLQ